VSRAPSKTAAASASLTRSNEDVPVFPGLDPVGERFGRGLADLLASFGYGESIIRATATQMTSVSEWQAGRSASDALLRFHMKPIKGPMLISMPVKLVAQLVDMFFGGDGLVATADHDFSPAERRFLTRLGEQCLPLLVAAWKDVISIQPQMVKIEPNGSKPALGKAQDLIAVQPFSISGPNGKSEIQCVFPVSALRPIEALRTAPESETAPAIDAVWRDRLEQAVLQVRLPIRSVFARPELSLEKLIALKPGDIIPVLMPRYVPISIGDRLFAHGSVGESNGRTAVKIESFL
jgi:flagellar motor switch protein FliM